MLEYNRAILTENADIYQYQNGVFLFVYMPDDYDRC